MYEETGVESLYQCFNTDSPYTVICACREHRHADRKDIPDKLKELLVAVNSFPISSAEFNCGFQIN